jgi:hypothetical protein
MDGNNVPCPKAALDGYPAFELMPTCLLNNYYRDEKIIRRQDETAWTGKWLVSSFFSSFPPFSPLAKQP